VLLEQLPTAVRSWKYTIVAPLLVLQLFRKQYICIHVKYIFASGNDAFYEVITNSVAEPEEAVGHRRGYGANGVRFESRVLETKT
jgi:hypothetical protein